MFSTHKWKCLVLAITLSFLATAAVFAAEDAKVSSTPAAGEMATVMVPMRDGVKLATDIDIPSGAKDPLPTLLIRSPYGRALGGITKILRGFIGNRYIVISQDTRGRGGSEGENLAFLNDQTDGYDTVEWIAAQSWSNGRVAILGASALAITGYQAAIASPPHLSCIVAVVAPADLQSQAILWGGQLRKDLAIGWTVGTDYPIETLTAMTDHPFYDDFAKKYDLTYNAGRVQTPMLHVGGWFDIFTEGTIRAYQSLQANGGTGARGLQRLIVGPWTHAGEISTKQGDLEFPQNSGIMPMVNGVLNWMDRCMEGKLKPEANPVQYYMMGDVDTQNSQWNVWKKSSAWPPENSAAQKWFLTPSGALETATPKHEKGFKYTFDPANPVKTAGGGNLTIGTDGPVDQREVENRPDVLLFNTPSLSEPFAIAGPVYADLLVSTTGCDTDFTAKLTDVYPDGRSILVIDGIARTRFRDADSGRLTTAAKNEKIPLRVFVGEVAYTFNKGHKMRLAISSSNHPRFSVNTNTCEDIPFPHKRMKAEYDAKVKKDKRSVTEGIEYEIVDNTVYTGGAAGSALVLPALKSEEK